MKLKHKGHEEEAMQIIGSMLRQVGTVREIPSVVTASIGTALFLEGFVIVPKEEVNGAMLERLRDSAQQKKHNKLVATEELVDRFKQIGWVDKPFNPMRKRIYRFKDTESIKSLGDTIQPVYIRGESNE